MRCRGVSVAAACMRQSFALVMPCAAPRRSTPLRADDIQVVDSTAHEPITVAADWCTHWQEGVYDVWHLRGNCYLNQGLTYARGPEAVLWVDARNFPQQPIKVIAYFEAGDGRARRRRLRQLAGDAASERRARPAARARRGSSGWKRPRRSSWKLPAAGRGAGRAPADLRARARAVQSRSPPAAAARAVQRVRARARRRRRPLPPGMRTFKFYPRSDAPYELDWKRLANGEMAAVVSGGVRVLIEGLPTEGLPAGFGPLGVVDISTDRAVVWASGVNPLAAGAGVQTQDAPLEIYMEGNIEFRQGDRVVYADRMFYDVRRQIGVILNAELLTPLPAIDDYQYQGLVRLKADAIRQLDDTHFAATNALVTTSRLGEPAYDFSPREI